MSRTFGMKILLCVALITLILSGCSDSASTPIEEDLVLGQTLSGALEGSGGVFTGMLEVEQGKRYGVAIGLGEGGAFSFGDVLVELLIDGDPLAERMSIRTDRDYGLFQTAGLSMTPNVFFEADRDGIVTLELTNASMSGLPGGFGVFEMIIGDTSRINFDLLVTEAASAGDESGFGDPGSDVVCSDSCIFAFDGECDDGGMGAVFSVCAWGTDCGDCGPRE